MQNLIVVCHRCFTWVETQVDVCPECGAEVRLEHPDPPLAALAQVLGKPLGVFGPLRVDRTALPNYGYLIGTTEGLLFLPRLHRRVNGAWEAVTSQRLPGWWPFRGDLASPRFLRWLRRPFGALGQDNQKQDKLAEQTANSLADRFLDSPGAFFVQLRHIQTITAKRRNVRLDRLPMKSITFIDETDDASLSASLNSHMARAQNEHMWHAR